MIKIKSEIKPSVFPAHFILYTEEKKNEISTREKIDFTGVAKICKDDNN